MIAMDMDFWVIVLVVLGCLFPNLLIDAAKATEEKDVREKRYRVGACFGAILLLLVMILN